MSYKDKVPENLDEIEAAVVDLTPEELAEAMAEAGNIAAKKRLEALKELENVDHSMFDQHLLPFLEKNPFFAELSRRIRKFPSIDVPTAGVAYDKERDDLVMMWNPKFIEKLSKAEMAGLLTHEFYHIVLQHITERRQEPHRMWNIAADLAINSLIVVEQKTVGPSILALPAGGLIPGQWPVKPDGRAMTDEEKKGAKLAAFIASLPVGETSEWYMEKLRKFADEQHANCPKHGDKSKQKAKPEKGAGDQEGDGGQEPGGESPGDAGDQEGDGDGKGSPGDAGEPQCTCGDDFADGFDSHDGWDNLSDDEREYVKNRVKDMVGKAVKHANSRPDGWGTMPASMREAIIASTVSIIDWRTVLRQFVGSVCRASKTSTMKRINRKYPYIHAGSKKNYLPKLLVAIDMSGSVGDEALALFFGELNTLTRQVSITVAPFDTEINDNDVFEWRKGQKVAAQRVKCGGTDFNAPTKFANDPKNRGRWDGLLILTDGCAPQPEVSRMKRGWVLAPGCKMEFPTQETVIQVANPPAKGR
jgi:predicted metal-dependent peptidase